MPTPSDTFGERQARRFLARKGYDRASLHNYRPHPAIVGRRTRNSTRASFMPFGNWKKDVKPFWDLNLGAARRRAKSKQFEVTHPSWAPRLAVQLGCWHSRRAAGLV